MKTITHHASRITHRILCLTAVALCLAVPKSHAQTAQSASISLPGTIAANTTSNYPTPVIIGSLKQQNVALSFTMSSTATATNLFVLQRSVDGSNWDTNSANQYTVQTLTATGASGTTTTNINVAGFNYLRIYSEQVIGTGTTTNNAFSYSVKIGAP